MHDVSIFPIERARSRFCILLLLIPLLAFPGYDWVIQYHVNIAVRLLLQCIIGFSNVWINNVYCTLIVDVFPKHPARPPRREALQSVLLALLSWQHWSRSRRPQAVAGSSVGLLYGVFGLPAVVLLERRGLKWRQTKKKRAEGNDGS